MSADYIVDKTAVIGRGQVGALADHVKSLREEQREVAEALNRRLEEVQRAVKALPEASDKQVKEFVELRERIEEQSMRLDQMSAQIQQLVDRRPWYKFWRRGG